jgi:hypothetical protein
LTKRRFLPEALHKTFVSLDENRVTSDYSVEAAPSSGETKEILEAARQFTESVETYLHEWLAKALEE